MSNVYKIFKTFVSSYKASEYIIKWCYISLQLCYISLQHKCAGNVKPFDQSQTSKDVSGTQVKCSQELLNYI